jgi:hypothetical protein
MLPSRRPPAKITPQGNYFSLARVNSVARPGLLPRARYQCKENSMRKVFVTASVAALFLLSLPLDLAKASPAPKAAPGSIVIVFKDGHRQVFNLADIARVEFPTANDAAAINPDMPSRGRFVGRWVVGDGSGTNFTITLKDNGDAERSLREVHGSWTYVNGEARVTWDDGAQDAIRKAGTKFQKYAYRAGKSFTDTPDNVTAAENTNPKPI